LLVAPIYRQTIKTIDQLKSLANLFVTVVYIEEDLRKEEINIDTKDVDEGFLIIENAVLFTAEAAIRNIVTLSKDKELDVFTVKLLEEYVNAFKVIPQRLRANFKLQDTVTTNERNISLLKSKLVCSN